MSLCTVTELRAVLGIGAVYTDAQLQEVCDSADAVLLPMLWTNSHTLIAREIANGTCTVYTEVPTWQLFSVGQTVTVTGAGAHFDGSKTLTAVGEYSLSFAPGDHPADFRRTSIEPYGSVIISETTDWTADPSIQLAAQFIAVDIWQARNAAGMGSIGIDGTPMPYRLNTQLLSKVRGMIAHALAPNGMVG